VPASVTLSRAPGAAGRVLHVDLPRARVLRGATGVAGVPPPIGRPTCSSRHGNSAQPPTRAREWWAPCDIPAMAFPAAAAVGIPEGGGSNTNQRERHWLGRP
jgi:hypothetical protein